MNRVAKTGDVLSLHYTLSFPDGEIIESTDGNGPVSIVLGQGEMDPGLESYLTGLQQDVQAEFLIQAGTAFGNVEAANVHPMSRDDFAQDNMPEEGYVLSFTTPSGEEIPGTIMEVTDEFVVVDFNHPLAGKEMIFKVEIKSISRV